MHAKSITCALRTKSNNFIIAYKLVFEKYPIGDCIDPEQCHPLSLKVVLDIDENNNIEKIWREILNKYITKIYKHSTKKPTNIINIYCDFSRI
ncbi:hypothetical protein GLOIN_2v1773792 [Rhizophagus irregularis DAOM 181602=DAOM 197198]|nr:hypothetical protein GLOIN_2v1773792 [Rhizophagus irregularis DAOM 181602=DAOM 197198]